MTKIMSAMAFSLLAVFLLNAVLMAQDFAPPVSSESYYVEFIEQAGAYQLPQGQRSAEDYEVARLYMLNLVELHYSYLDQIESALPGISQRVGYHFYRVMNGLTLRCSEAEADTIRALPFVAEVIKSQKTEAFLDSSVNQIATPFFWSFPPGYEGTGIRVGVADTGVDWTSDDFGSCHDMGPDCQVRDGWDFVNNDPSPKDDQGHGTHVAAIIASNHPVYRGVAPGVSIYAYKVIDASGGGEEEDVTAAMEMMADPNQDFDLSDHLDVANFSLGGHDTNSPEGSAAHANALSRVGTVVVAAAGNTGGYNGVGAPASAVEAIAVGAVTDLDIPSSFSSRGPAYLSGRVKPDVVAPGGTGHGATGSNICAARAFELLPEYPSCGVDSSHVELLGTSMAAPHVAGLAAILRQMNPAWRPEQIKYALRNSALKLTSPSSPDGYVDYLTQGQGRVQASQQCFDSPVIARLERTSDSETGVEFEAYVGKYDASGQAFHYRFDLGFMGIEPGASGSFIANPESWKFVTEGLAHTTSAELAQVTLPVVEKLRLRDGMHLARLQILSASDHILSTDYYSFKVKNLKVTNPFDCDVQGKNISFTGVLNFDPQDGHYRIQYRPYMQTQEPWSEAGIVLPNSGSTPPVTADLGSFTAPDGLGTGAYQFRAVIKQGEEIVNSRDIAVVYLDMGMAWNNPVFSGRYPTQTSPGAFEWDTGHYIMPQIADLSPAIGKVIVFPTQNSSGTAMRLKRLMYGGNYYSAMSYQPDYFRIDPFSLLAGDLVADSQAELGLGGELSYPETEEAHRFSLISSMGNQYANLNWEGDGKPTGTYPIRADLNRDGSPEIILLQRRQHVWSHWREIKILDASLNSLATQDMTWQDTGYSYRSSNLVIGNFDHDQDLEVAYVGRVSILGQLNAPVKALVFNYDGSLVRESILVSDNPGDAGSMPQAAAADFNNDGIDELVLAMQATGVTVINVATGATYDEGSGPGWPRFGFESPWAGEMDFPAIGDVDGDGDLEIVIPLQNSLHVLNSNGSELPGWPAFLNGKEDSGALITDLDGDHQTEIVYEDVSQPYGLCSFGLLHARNAVSGSELEGFPKFVEKAAVQGKNVVDLNGDGQLELITASDGQERFWAGGRGSDPLTQHQVRDSIYMWALPQSGSRPVGDWTTARGDHHRTGRYWGLAAPLYPYYEPIRGGGSGTIGWSAPGNGNAGSNYVVQVSPQRTFAGAQSIRLKGSQRSWQLPPMRQGTYWARVGSYDSLSSRTAWGRPVRVVIGRVDVPAFELIE